MIEARSVRRRIVALVVMSAVALVMFTRTPGSGSVRWVQNQKQRWGSCTPGDRTIRLSVRLQGMPGWVIDYVLVHELSHLIEPGHDAAFWGWVDRYPQAERAKGYLIGWSAAARLEPPPGEDSGEVD